MSLTYTEALVLREIANGGAELNFNYEPAILYINNYQPGNDPSVMKMLGLYKQRSLIDEQIINGIFHVYTINEAGRDELNKHFRKSKSVQA